MVEGAANTRINNHAGLIWSIADLLRGDYKRSEYGRVILPLVVLRRLDCVLEPTKQQVLARLEAVECTIRWRNGHRMRRREACQRLRRGWPRGFRGARRRRRDDDCRARSGLRLGQLANEQPEEGLGEAACAAPCLANQPQARVKSHDAV